MCYLALYLHYTSSNNPVLKTRKFSLYQLRCYETACPSIKNIFVSFVFTAVYNQFCRCYPSFNHCTKGFAVNVKGSFCSLRTRGVRSSNQGVDLGSGLTLNTKTAVILLPAHLLLSAGFFFSPLY